MAKKKRSVEDLDAELAALEAELASLEGRKPEAKPKAPEAAPAPAAAPPAAPPPAPEPAKKKGLRFPLGGKKDKKPAQGIAPPAHRPIAAGEFPLEPAPVSPLPPPDAAPLTGPSLYDASLWRQEDEAWVRTVPGEPRVVRRILDENGIVVREEPATRRDLDEVTEVKAERAVGKLLGRFKR